MKESNIEKKANTHAMNLGYLFHAKFKSEHNRAVQDRLYVNEYGLTIYIEYKAPGKTPTDAQKRKAKQMGHPVTPIFWVDNLDAAKLILAECSRWTMPHSPRAIMHLVGEKYTCFDL